MTKSLAKLDVDFDVNINFDVDVGHFPHLHDGHHFHLKVGHHVNFMPVPFFLATLSATMSTSILATTMLSRRFVRA